MKLNVIIFGFLVILTSFSFAQNGAMAKEVIPCPEHKVGQTYSFLEKNFRKEIERNWRVTAVNVNTIETDNSFGGEPATHDLVFNLIKGRFGQSYSPKLNTIPDCPFALGDVKNYSDYKYTNKDGGVIEGPLVVTVADSFTEVTTPAGKFKVVRIVSKLAYNWRVSSFSGNGSATYVSYYAPSIGNVVMFEHRGNQSSGLSESIETTLVRYFLE